jgi:anti-sigma regulatory factor (Ser/Thr protein kinase)
MNQAVGKESIDLKNNVARKARGQQTATSSELLSLEFPACSEYLGKARHALAGMAEQLHLTIEDTGDLLLATGEACNNAVQYGRGSEFGVLQVRCRLNVPGGACKGRALQIEITNHGNGFLPAKNDSIFAMPEVEDLGTHGRGLPLMRELMDDVQIFCENGNTVVRLTKRISK